MSNRPNTLCRASFWLSIAGTLMPLVQCQNQPQQALQRDSSYIDAIGTAHVVRVIPVPKTVSPEAQELLSRPESDTAIHQDLATSRRNTDVWQAGVGEQLRVLYPVKSISTETIAGVSVRIILPLNIPASEQDRVLIDLHGGGFMSDSGSLSETIPIANLTRTKVVAVLYRLAPEHPFPAAVDDAVAVYKELLKTYQPRNVAMYGTSAGAMLATEVVTRLKQLELPLPAALGVFSGMGDFSRLGDSQAIFALNGLSGHLDPPMETLRAYIGSNSPTDPVLSPIFSNLHGMPPTLFITSTRDLLLSGTVILHRAFLQAGDDAQLVVFEALPHAFWNNPQLPESREANRMMAAFFNKNLGR
jgi:epsilon-lactone hydrolase